MTERIKKIDWKKNLLMIIGLLGAPRLFAKSQELFEEGVAMADVMRAEGKIYVVVAIVMIILVGFFIYLFFIDRKLSSIEKLIDKEATDKNSY